jgi:enterochelin esterase-like enzyme
MQNSSLGVPGPMKFLFLSIALIMLAAATSAGAPDLPWREGMASPRLEMLKKQVQSGGAGAVEAFWEEMKARHTPLVERLSGEKDHLLVTFLYRAERPLKGVVLISQLTSSRDPAAIVLARLPGTDVWYKTYLLRNDMRLSYSFVPDPTPESLAYHSELQLRDPLNPAYLPDMANVGHSVLQLPAAAPQPWIAAMPGVPAGKIEEMQVESKILNSQRRAWVYVPAGYDPNRNTPYALLACFDGFVYSSPEWVPTPAILDNLIGAGKIPPTIAVFIDQAPPPKRNLELSNNPQFADFVAQELLPQVRKKWRATSGPAQTTACGSSAGGLASAFVAFRHPEVFGNVLSQSGAFWPGKTRDNPEQEWLTRQFESSEKLPLRFVLQVGVLEIVATPLNGPSILAANRRLRDVLRAKGYEVHYSEVAGGHEPLTWRGGIAEGLVQLLGSENKSGK